MDYIIQIVETFLYKIQDPVTKTSPFIYLRQQKSTVLMVFRDTFQ